jgi:hypothetical protein
MTQNPAALLLRAIGLWLRGRVRFPGDSAGNGREGRGDRLEAFRKVVLESTSSRPIRAGAVFQVRFRFKNLSAAANRWLSLVPIPLIVAQPGFRSKTWLLDQESGAFVGRYEFDTVDEAEAYWDSLPMRLMRRRAVPGSLRHSITETRATVASQLHDLGGPTGGAGEGRPEE